MGRKLIFRVFPSPVKHEGFYANVKGRKIEPSLPTLAKAYKKQMKQDEKLSF